jgi:hypothetical protein
MFIDWISMYQRHEHSLPLIDDGVVQGVDSDGQLVWQTVRGFQFQGSFDTKIMVSCDGNTVKFSGNPSRFGRPDNVFGYDLATCLRRVNLIVGKLGLPPFTAGRRMLRPMRRSSFDFGNVEADQQIRQLHLVQPAFRQVLRSSNEAIVDVEFTGARITRLDLTQNYSLGGPDSARHYLQWLFTQQPSRITKVGTYPDGSTVDWGRGSRRIYSKFYLKFIEMARGHLTHSPKLVEWATNEGLGRFELSLKSTQLQTMGCQYLGSLDMEQLEAEFEERSKILTRATMDVDGLDDLPNAIRLTARDYLSGADMSLMPSSTFRRKRASLLPFGIDISVPRNIYQFQPRVRVIELKPAQMPYFYQLDERLAA